MNTCAEPSCGNPVRQANTGRPALYCGDTCRKTVYRHRKQRERYEEEARAERAAAVELREAQLALAVEIVTEAAQHPAAVAEALADWMSRRGTMWDRDARYESILSFRLFLTTHRHQLALDE